MKRNERMNYDQVSEGDVFVRNQTTAKIRIVSRDFCGVVVETLSEDGSTSKRRRITWGTLRESYKKCK